MMTGGPDGKMEMWSPEELVMETPLSKSFAEQNLAANARSAMDSAKKVNGRWTTFFAFRKSPMGIGFRLPPVERDREAGTIGTSGPRGTDGLSEPHRPNFDPVKHNPNDRFARLTPEQRVQQARQRSQGGGGQVVERRIEQN
jgi:hypothetical protein